jgi:hypothetical protein
VGRLTERTSPDWVWCLKIGLVVVLIDSLTVFVARGAGPESALAAAMDTLDQIANVALFSYVGFRTGLQTGRATAAAEAGVCASLLPALAAALYQLLLPPEATTAGEVLPLPNRIIAAVALNVVMAGLSAWIAGWFAGKSRPPAR